MIRKSLKHWQSYAVLGLIAVVVAFFGLGRSGDERAAAQAPQVQIRGQGFIQFGRRLQRSSTDDEVLDGVFLPADREVTRQLEKAKEMLEDGRYDDTSMLLDEILQRGEDFFFKPDPTKPVHRSLKAEAHRLIGAMPASGRSAYQLQFEPRAKQLLSEAVATGNLAQLEEVSRRYFHTPSGYEATLILGRHHLDHGQPLAAVLCFERLKETPEASRFEPGLSIQLASAWTRASMPKRAAEVLVALRKSHPRATIRIGDEEHQLFNRDGDANSWLAKVLGKPVETQRSESEQWAMHRGNAARNAASGGGSPLLSPRWRVPTTNHPALEKALADIRQTYVDQGIPVAPCMHPLAVNDLVLMRTSRDLLAVDFETGKRLWEVRGAADGSLENAVTAYTGANAGQFEPQANPVLVNRFWDDSTFGTLSSDGERVFLIEDAEMGIASARNQRNQRFAVLANGRRRMLSDGLQQSNKLIALELKTQGKLLWEVGGSVEDDNSPLATAFFLGAPLPMQGKVYVLAEVKGEIKLFVLDAKTGNVEWSQQLAAVEQDVLRDAFRRFAGCTPSFADGVLVCPTSAGAVVAVDLSNRSLLWGYQYQRNQYAQAGGRIFPGAMGARVVIGWNGEWPQASQAARWIDSSATIAEGRVLLTPVESNELHCLNLIDGKPAWSAPMNRGENLYVGCVHKGKVVLVGMHQVTALKLTDGKAAWKTPVELPSGAMPSGRGFLSGDDYYLPLTSAEVIRINLKDGKITARSKSRKNSIPGNLICYKGEVISQGVDYLETFFQLEPLQQRIEELIAKNPKDAWALAHRGELALDEGRLDDALRDIRASFEIDPAPYTRDLLVESLLAVLSKDFDKNRSAAQELDALAESDEERIALFRALATGLRKSGDVLGSLEAFLNLSLIDRSSDTLDEIDPQLSASRDCWARAEFKALLAESSKGDREQIDQAIAKRLEVAEAGGDIRALERFLAVFGDHPIADQVRETLVERIGGETNLLARERLLRQLERSSDPEVRMSAMLKLAAILRDSEHTEEALDYYRRIEAEFGDKALVGKETVKAYLAGLPADSKLARVIAMENFRWPEGEVKVEKSNTRAVTVLKFGRLIPLDWRQDRGPFFKQIEVGFHQNQNEIIGRDGLGNERFRVSLNENGRPRSYPHLLNNIGQVTAFNHILLVSTGSQLYAIDTLRSTAAPGSRVLWAQDLVDQPGGASYGYQNISQQQVKTFWGGTRTVANIGGQPVGSVGPCTTTGVCLQRSRDVMMLDPLTGSTHWIRRGLTPGSELFGDEELILVASPTGNGSETTVLRAFDGQLLGKRKIPTLDQRWTTVGRNVLAWKNLPDGRMTLFLYDPWSESDVWSHTFLHGTKATLVNQESAAVMQRDGKFMMIDLASGKVAFEHKLEAEPNLQNIFVVRSTDQDILITNRPAPPVRQEGGAGKQPVNRMPMVPSDQASPLITGHVYAFDRNTGKAQWPKPAYVEQYGLAMNQSPELPVLSFVRNWQTTRQNRQVRNGAILCLDKRTGGLVFEDNELHQLASFETSGDMDEKSVMLLSTLQSIKLQFTDKPVAAETPYDASKPEKKKSTSEGGRAGALFRALGRGAQSALEGNSPPKNPAPFEDDD